MLGPNTLAPPEVLAESVLLCCGEDRDALLRALGVSSAAPPASGLVPVARHRYRCYEFWRLPFPGGSRAPGPGPGAEFTLIWTGIGTGCLEPLLWEILGPGIVRRIVLIGTAGAFRGAAVAPGEVYLVDRAYSAGTGIDALADVAEPHAPYWPGVPAHVPRAASASTDFFFGFSPRVLDGRYPLSHGELRRRYEWLATRAALVEMEVAPFYCFCRAFSGPGSPSAGLRFAALKGVSNLLEADEQQAALTDPVLDRGAALALEMLRA